MEMLEGLRVLDFSNNAAGPVAASMLADYGARVIKIERPGRGDDCRAFPPFLDGKSLAHGWFNRGKRSVTIDLTDNDGLAVVKRMIADADVLVESFRPGVMERMGLGYSEASAISPDIIYCSVSAFGQTGPYSRLPGYDIIAQAMSGIMNITGEADGPPMKSGVALGDLFGGVNAYGAILTALYHRKRTGEGQHIDVSLLQGLIWMNTTLEKVNEGSIAMRQGNHHTILCPYGLFRGANGQSVVIAAANDKLWRKLCEAMRRPDLADNNRFLTVRDRVNNQRELISEIEGWLGSFRDVREAAQLLNEHGVPSAKVYTNEDVAKDAHVLENGWLVEMPPADGVTSREKILTRGVNARFSKRPGSIKMAPELGEANREILRKHGLSDEQIEELQARWNQA